MAQSNKVTAQNSESSHPLQNFFEPVGKVIVLFNHLDQLLLLVTVGLCAAEFDAVSALMAEAPFRKKIDAFKCICDHKVSNEAIKVRITGLIVSLQKSEDLRNGIAHTVWMQNEERTFSMKWTAKRKTGNDPRLRSGDLDAVHDAAKSIQSTSLELCRISDALYQMGLSKMHLKTDSNTTIQ